MPGVVATAPASSGTRSLSATSLCFLLNQSHLGFNAPETGDRALCDAERHKGEAAKRRLRESVSSGSPAFQQIARSCKSGTEGTNAYNFGRRCGTLQVNGVDVGATLIAEGLAVRFVCGATSCSKLPQRRLAENAISKLEQNRHKPYPKRSFKFGDCRKEKGTQGHRKPVALPSGIEPLSPP